MTLLTLFFFVFYFILSNASYFFFDGFAIYLLLAWYVTGVSHFFSVTFDPASALLGACLLPGLHICSIFDEVNSLFLSSTAAVLVSMFGGTTTTWPDMTNLQQAIAKIGPGW
jgi:hypothetical protein